MFHSTFSNCTIGTLQNDVSNTNTETDINFIGKLQEFCSGRQFLIPTYESDGGVGMPHEKFFTVTVRVGNLEKTGLINILMLDFLSN